MRTPLVEECIAKIDKKTNKLLTNGNEYSMDNGDTWDELTYENLMYELGKLN